MTTEVIENSLPRQNKSNNKRGLNQFSVHNTLTPYGLRFIHAKTLIDEGKTVDQIMASTGLCRESVVRVKKGEIKLADSWVEAAKRVESKKLTFLSNTILDSINEKDLNSASLLQKTTAASQLIDKRRLIDGESTQNVAHAGLIDTLAQDREALMARLKYISDESV
jgi:hypothetical protein